MRRALRGDGLRAALPRLLAVALVAALLSAGAAEATPAPRLRAQLKSARLVVGGTVTRVTPYDNDRVAVVELSVERVLKGSLTGNPPAPIALVELHEGPVRPELAVGTHGIAFLRAASHLSYLTNALPAGTYYELLPEFGAFMPAASTADLEHEAALLARVVAAASGKGFDAAQERQLTFELLASSSPLLVEDAAAGVASLGGQHALTDDEMATLAAALQRADLPDRVRIGLIEAVAKAGMTEAVPALQQVTAPPAVAEAAWRALDDLGHPPSDTAMAARLADPDPSVRANAARELLHRDGVAAISQVAPLAVQDPDPAVRQAVVEALGKLGKAEALPTLERVFSGDSTELQQAAARAILAIGGEPAVDAFGRLAFHGPIQSQRYAVVVLMTLSGPDKDSTLQRISHTHPDEKIRDLVANGFPNFAN